MRMRMLPGVLPGVLTVMGLPGMGQQEQEYRCPRQLRLIVPEKNLIRT